MKAYKQKTIGAVREFIDVKYMLPVNKLHFAPRHCPLCQIYKDCKGCINMVFDDGCNSSKTFKRLKGWMTVQDRDIKRKFWEIVLPKLKDIPAKYFTPSGFKRKPFEFMIKIDNLA